MNFTTVVRFGLFWLSACTVTVEPEIAQLPDRLVVNALLVPDQPFGIRVSSSRYILAETDTFASVDDAQVTLFEDGRAVAQPEHTGAGWYASEFWPQPGHRYDLQVSSETRGTVAASSELHPAVAIQQLTADSVPTRIISCAGANCTSEYITDYELQLRLTDPGGHGFYEVLGYATVQDSVPVRNNTGDSVGYEVLQRPHRLNFVTDDLAIDRANLGVAGDSIFGTSLLFSNNIFAGKSYTLSFATDNDQPRRAVRLTILLRTLSEAQYQYLRTRWLAEDTSGDPFAEPVPVFSNVENGYGIFASYSVDSVVVKLN